jgi:hypothetical protein
MSKPGSTLSMSSVKRNQRQAENKADIAADLGFVMLFSLHHLVYSVECIPANPIAV